LPITDADMLPPRRARVIACLLIKLTGRPRPWNTTVFNIAFSPHTHTHAHARSPLRPTTRLFLDSFVYLYHRHGEKKQVANGCVLLQYEDLFRRVYKYLSWHQRVSWTPVLQLRSPHVIFWLAFFSCLPVSPRLLPSVMFPFHVLTRRRWAIDSVLVVF